METAYDNGRYTYSFTDGVQPVSFAAYDDGARSIIFNVADATNISIPDDWSLTTSESGFSLSYTGTLPAYPIGYLPLEISFDSAFLPEDVDPENPSTGPLSGAVSGPVILDYTLGRGGGTGYGSFYYGVVLTESPIYTRTQLLAADFLPEDLVPVATGIRVVDNLVCIELNNIFAGVIYDLEYSASLDLVNWVPIESFTHIDVDENNCIFTAKNGPKGYFRVFMPE